MSAVPTSADGVEAALADLRLALATMLADGQPASVRVAERIALMLQSANTDLTVEQAFGLQGASGFGWKSVLRRTRRDELIRSIAGRYFPGQKGRAIARAIEHEIARARSLPRRRGLDNPGTLLAMARELATLGSAPSRATIERVLTHECESNQGDRWLNHADEFEPRRAVSSPADQPGDR